MVLYKCKDDRKNEMVGCMTRPSLNCSVMRAGNPAGACQHPYLFDWSVFRPSVLQRYNRASASHSKQRTCNRAIYSGHATRATCNGGYRASCAGRGFQGVPTAGKCDPVGASEVGGGRVECSYITELGRVMGPPVKLSTGGGSPPLGWQPIWSHRPIHPIHLTETVDIYAI